MTKKQTTTADDFRIWYYWIWEKRDDTFKRVTKKVFEKHICSHSEFRVQGCYKGGRKTEFFFLDGAGLSLPYKDNVIKILREEMDETVEHDKSFAWLWRKGDDSVMRWDKDDYVDVINDSKRTIVEVLCNKGEIVKVIRLDGANHALPAAVYKTIVERTEDLCKKDNNDATCSKKSIYQSTLEDRVTLLADRIYSEDEVNYP